MALVDFKKGRALTAREIKAATLSATGWTTEQYNKEYDKLRNRTRHYERASGLTAGTYQVNELLYREALAQKKHGDSYRPSALMRDIRASTSYSTGEAQRVAALRVSRERALTGIEQSFAGAAQKHAPVAEMLTRARQQIAAGADVDLSALKTELQTEIKSAKEYNRAQERARGLPRGSYKGGYDRGSEYKES